MPNAHGFERSVPSGPRGDCDRCELRDSMDGSRYCPGCAAFLNTIRA